MQEVNQDLEGQSELRNQQSAQNKKEAEVSQANQDACSGAITVLQEYFAAGPAEGQSEIQTSFVQTKMQTRSRDANSVIYLLQEAEADFARLLADVKSIESEQASTFEKVEQDLKMERATSQETLKGYANEIARLGTFIHEAGTDLDNADKEHDASLDYAARIKEECEVKVPSFEERQKRREQEIDGLKQALDILNGEGV